MTSTRRSAAAPGVRSTTQLRLAAPPPPRSEAWPTEPDAAARFIFQFAQDLVARCVLATPDPWAAASSDGVDGGHLLWSRIETLLARAPNAYASGATLHALLVRGTRHGLFAQYTPSSAAYCSAIAEYLAGTRAIDDVYLTITDRPLGASPDHGTIPAAAIRAHASRRMDASAVLRAPEPIPVAHCTQCDATLPASFAGWEHACPLPPDRLAAPGHIVPGPPRGTPITPAAGDPTTDAPVLLTSPADDSDDALLDDPLVFPLADPVLAAIEELMHQQRLAEQAVRLLHAQARDDSAFALALSGHAAIDRTTRGLGALALEIARLRAAATGSSVDHDTPAGGPSAGARVAPASRAGRLDLVPRNPPFA